MARRNRSSKRAPFAGGKTSQKSSPAKSPRLMFSVRSASALTYENRQSRSSAKKESLILSRIVEVRWCAASASARNAPLVFRRLPAQTAHRQMRTDSGQQFARGKRLNHVIVRASFHPFDTRVFPARAERRITGMVLVESLARISRSKPKPSSPGIITSVSTKVRSDRSGSSQRFRPRKRHEHRNCHQKPTHISSHIRVVISEQNSSARRLDMRRLHRIRSEHLAAIPSSARLRATIVRLHPHMPPPIPRSTSASAAAIRADWQASVRGPLESETINVLPLPNAALHPDRATM